MTLSQRIAIAGLPRTRFYVAAALGLGALGATSSLIEWHDLRRDTAQPPFADRVAAVQTRDSRSTASDASMPANGMAMDPAERSGQPDAARIASAEVGTETSAHPARPRRKVTAALFDHATPRPTVQAPPPLTQQAADELLELGRETYGMGDVARGIRLMERARANGAQGALRPLCAIYRTPTAAQGMDYAKEVRNCNGVE